MLRTAIAVAAVAAVSAEAKPAASNMWIIDKSASQLGFRSSMGGTPFSGTFRRWDARISFDPAALGKSSVTVAVDLASASTGDASRDQSLPTSDWFDTSRFPRATFTSNSFKSLGGNRYAAAGVLTIKGVARPVVLPFQVAIAGDTARAQGALAINRSVFGVGKGQFAGPDSIPFNVQVVVRINAVRAR